MILFYLSLVFGVCSIIMLIFSNLYVFKKKIDFYDDCFSILNITSANFSLLCLLLIFSFSINYEDKLFLRNIYPFVVIYAVLMSSLLYSTRILVELNLKNKIIKKH